VPFDLAEIKSLRAREADDLLGHPQAGRLALHKKPGPLPWFFSDMAQGSGYGVDMVSEGRIWHTVRVQYMFAK
jgi:hypothetical protein